MDPAIIILREVSQEKKKTDTTGCHVSLENWEWIPMKQQTKQKETQKVKLRLPEGIDGGRDQLARWVGG